MSPNSEFFQCCLRWQKISKKNSNAIFCWALASLWKVFIKFHWPLEIFIPRHSIAFVVGTHYSVGGRTASRKVRFSIHLEVFVQLIHKVEIWIVKFLLASLCKMHSYKLSVQRSQSKGPILYLVFLSWSS